MPTKIQNSYTLIQLNSKNNHDKIKYKKNTNSMDKLDKINI